MTTPDQKWTAIDSMVQGLLVTLVLLALISCARHWASVGASRGDCPCPPGSALP